MNKTSIVIDGSVKNQIDNFYYSIKTSIIKSKSKKKLTWNDFMGNIFDNAKIVGGTVLECRAVF